VTLQSLKELPDSVEAVFSVSMEGKEAAKPCCVAEWMFVIILDSAGRFGA